MALAGVHEVEKVKAFRSGIDSLDLTQNILEFQPETLAIDRIASRFRIGRHHARVVCELAGIGGAV